MNRQPIREDSISEATQALQAGLPDKALVSLATLSKNFPDDAYACRLRVSALLKLGRFAEAESEAARLCALRPDDVHLKLDWVKIVIRRGDPARAERSLRALLGRFPQFVEAAVTLADLLNDYGAPSAALDVLSAFDGNASVEINRARGSSLKALGRFEEALYAFERSKAPGRHDALAEHNLAAAYADLKRWEESLERSDAAFRYGLEAPEAWFVRGHALQGLGRREEAAAAYRKAIDSRPNFAAAHADLARLIWAESGDLNAAMAPLEAAIDSLQPAAAIDLHLEQSRILSSLGEGARAYRNLRPALERLPDEPRLNAAAAVCLLAHQPVDALAYARAAQRLAPGVEWIERLLVEGLMGNGEYDEADGRLRELEARFPSDARHVAIRATLLKALGEEEYYELYDYARLVRCSEIKTPDGWSTRGSYLEDLRRALRKHHDTTAHPVGQSVRAGTQTEDLLASDEPAIKAFFAFVATAVENYMASALNLAPSLRPPSGAQAHVTGAWSIMLTAGAGRHINHIHNKGVLSSAFYVSVPDAVRTRAPEGWLTFGQTGAALAVDDEADYLIRPQEGLLVLFPSYMWHGTRPFTGGGERLTIAFDVAFKTA